MLKNIKLGVKLGLAFGLILTLLVIVISVDRYAAKSMLAGFQKHLKVDMAIGAHAGRIESLMLQGRRNEKDFMLRLDKKYLGKHAENIAKLTDQANSIVGLATESENSQIKDLASSIIGFASTYKSSFQKLVEAHERKGLNHESGLQGRFRGAAHELQKFFAERNVDELYLSLLQIRRYEKDYITTKSLKYKNKLLSVLSVYKQQISNSKCLNSAKIEVQKGLKDYLGALNSFFSTQNDIYIERMRSAAHVMERSIDSIYIPNGTALILSIRKDEKDYMLRGNKKYVKNVAAGLARLSKALDSSEMSEADKNKSKANIATYDEAFKALVAEDQVITELISSMRTAVHQIEPAVENIMQKSNEISDRTAKITAERADMLGVVSGSIGGVAIVVGILFAGGIVKLITVPILKAVAFAQEIEKGNLTASVDIHQKDEIGVLADALRSMGKKLDSIFRTFSEHHRMLRQEVMNCLLRQM